MLVDEVKIIVRGGKGGGGQVSFNDRVGPDGGDGGNGGNIYINVISDLYALNQFLSKNVLQAGDGRPGGSNKRSGDKGKDLTLSLPVGSVLMEEDGRQTPLDKRGLSLDKLDENILLVKGGLGGRGNASFKSSTNTSPEYSQPGLPGEEKKLKLELRLIADFGLVGLPNAGKSSLLNELTNAKAKIGDYPFTTLEPNLGILNGKVLADIPGLIEGASEGKGLGHKFLKHIEKVKLILHCISSDSEDVRNDYEIIRRELKEFNPALLDKDEIIILTKSDLSPQNDLDKKIKSLREAPATLAHSAEVASATKAGRSRYLLPVLRRERNPSEAERDSHSSASLRSQFSAKGDKTKRKIINVSIHDLESLEALIKTLTEY